MKELIGIALAIALSMAGAVYFVPNISTKMLNQSILSSNDFVNGLRNTALDFASLSPTQDYQNISMEQVKTKKLIPSNSVVVGTGSTSKLTPPYDAKQAITIADPNSASTTDQGKQFIITINASASKLDPDEKQIWEDKLKSNFERAGGLVTSYTTTNADAIISVTFE